MDDFEQNLEGVDKGEPGPLMPETADLLKVLLHYLPFSGKMTQLIITSRYAFSLTEQNREMVEERLEKVWLTSFQETEQLKKAQALKHILNYKEQSLKPQLLKAGHGNPRLMEWLDQLVGIMMKPEITQIIRRRKKQTRRFHSAACHPRTAPTWWKRIGTFFTLVQYLSPPGTPGRSGIIVAEKARLNRLARIA